MIELLPRRGIFSVLHACTPLRVVALAIAIFASSVGHASAANQPDGLTPAQREAVEETIRKVIIENPDLILQSIRAMEERDRLAKEAAAKDAVKRRGAELFRDPDSEVTGNPDGDITVVEFFDYQCGYCKRVYPTVKRLLEQDPNIKLVYKEFPILGPASTFAAQSAIASRAQGKYESFHNALMESKGQLSEKRVLQIAEKVGLNVARLSSDMKAQAPETEKILALNYQLSSELNITGTPAFVIGETIIRGAVGLEELQGVVAETRAKRKDAER